MVVPDGLLQGDRLPRGVALPHPRHVAQQVDGGGNPGEGQEREPRLAHDGRPRARPPAVPPGARGQEHEAEEAPGEEARPAGREREPEGEARRRHRPEPEPFRGRRAHHEEGREQLEQHREDVGHGDAALHQVDPVEEQQEGREKRRPLGREHPPREQEEDRGEERSRERGRQAPGPGRVAEESDPRRDQELGGRRVDPLRGRLAPQVLERRLGVVHLVEVLLGGVAEPGQAKEGRREHDTGQDEARPPRLGRQALQEAVEHCGWPQRPAARSCVPGAPMRRATAASASRTQLDEPIRT